MIAFATAPTLPEFFFDSYLPLRLVGESPKTVVAYRTALNRWTKFAGDLPMDRIDGRLLAKFQQHLLQSLKPASVNTYCNHLMVILRFAANDEEAAVIGRIPRWNKLREPKRVPLAFTTEEFSKVLAEAKRWPVPIAGYSAADWWEAVLLTCWESGLRYKSLMLLRSVDVLFDSGGLYCQAEPQKDKEAQWFALPPNVLDALRKIYQPSRELLFPRTVTIEVVGRWFRKVLDSSGIYAPKGCGTRWHRIRKSKASYTEAMGGDAQRELGHSQRSVTERYLDPRIVGRGKTLYMPLPTSL
jgi:integrase